jgi:hypothetical protein
MDGLYTPSQTHVSHVRQSGLGAYTNQFHISIRLPSPLGIQSHIVSNIAMETHSHMFIKVEYIHDRMFNTIL